MVLAFMGLTSSRDVTVSQTLSTERNPVQRIFLTTGPTGVDALAANRKRWCLSPAPSRPIGRCFGRNTALTSRLVIALCDNVFEHCFDAQRCRLASVPRLDLAKRPTGVGNRIPILSVPAVRRERHQRRSAHVGDRIPPIAVLAAQRRRRHRRLAHVGDRIPPLPVLAIKRLRRAGRRHH
jgi:hypothetical protein